MFTCILFGVLVVNSCMNHNNDAENLANEKNELKAEEKAFDERDGQFLVRAAAINLEEIKLGELASQKGTTPHVKELGQMMEQSHKKLHAALMTLAEAKSISLPDVIAEEGLMLYYQLKDKDGTDLDKAYCKMMVKNHRQAIDLFENAVYNSNDPEILQWATATLPILREHLDLANRCTENYP